MSDDCPLIYHRSVRNGKIAAYDVGQSPESPGPK